MRVKDLIKQLSKFPQDLEVDVTRYSDFDSINGQWKLIHMEIAEVSKIKTENGKSVVEIHISY